MRVYNQDSLYRITVSTADVYKFRRQWPVSGLPTDCRFSFTFEKHTGDLVDMTGPRLDGSAIGALADDAMCVGAERLKLQEVLESRCAEFQTHRPKWLRR